MRDRLAGQRIGRWGQLLEWLQEQQHPVLDTPHDTHRHVSHLFAVYPGRQITPRRTPALAEAARRSLHARGDAGTGWSMAWKAALWARLHDGDRAHQLLRGLLATPGAGAAREGRSGSEHNPAGGSHDNLLATHPPFQIDANFGAVAAVAEMLLQSHDGEIELLPALPRAWPNGEVRGLRARGGVQVDIAWSDGRLQQARLQRLAGRGPLRLRSGATVRELHLAPGQALRVNAALEPQAPQGPAAWTLFDGRPAPGLRLQVADQEAETPFPTDEARAAAGVQVPRPPEPKVPASAVQARRVAGPGARGEPRARGEPGGQGGPDPQAGASAVALQWQEAWYAALRLETLPGAPPLDLRPYLEDGTLEFELRALDLARGGLSVAMACGPGCERRLNFVVDSRPMVGQGWQRLAFALRCFEREGADFSAVTRPFVLESSGFGQVELARVRLVRHGRPNRPCVDHRSESVTPRPLQEVWALDWWMPRHQAKLAEIRARSAAGRPPALVFIGDSITHGWENPAEGLPHWQRHFEPLGALNLGYGGDRTENVLWRLQNGELDGYQARAVVLLIGTNNTGHRQEDPATTAAGVARLLQEIRQRQPQARVLLLAVFPRDEQPDTPLRRLNKALNQRLERLADGQHVHWLDIGAVLSNPDGSLSRELMPDWLHLSPAAYGRWAEAILPTVQRLLSPP